MNVGAFSWSTTYWHTLSYTHSHSHTTTTTQTSKWIWNVHINMDIGATCAHSHAQHELHPLDKIELLIFPLEIELNWVCTRNVLRLWYNMVWYGSNRLALLVFVQLYHAVEMCLGQLVMVVWALFHGKRCAHGIDGLQPTIKSIISMNGFWCASKESWDLQDTHLYTVYVTTKRALCEF